MAKPQASTLVAANVAKIPMMSVVLEKKLTKKQSMLLIEPVKFV